MVLMVRDIDDAMYSICQSFGGGELPPPLRIMSNPPKNNYFTRTTTITFL